METTQRPTADERCRAEATKNVVFLFQGRRWIHTGMPYCGTIGKEYGCDGEGVCLGTVNGGLWEPDEDADYLTNEQLSRMENIDDVPCAIETWETESVWMTREDAEKYGKSRSHNYRDGWRVYGVPCDGAMWAAIKAAEQAEGGE